MKIPNDYQDLLKQPNVAHFATKNPDGSLQISPIWVDYDDENDVILINTARGRRKDRNLEKNAPVALSITDPENIYRYIAIQGTVIDISEEGAVDHIDKLANKYLGKEEYGVPEGETRIKVTIEPQHISTGG